jgi:hypothetical protein
MRPTGCQAGVSAGCACLNFSMWSVLRFLTDSPRHIVVNQFVQTSLAAQVPGSGSQTIAGTPSGYPQFSALFVGYKPVVSLLLFIPAYVARNRLPDHLNPSSTRSVAGFAVDPPASNANANSSATLATWRIASFYFIAHSSRISKKISASIIDKNQIGAEEMASAEMERQFAAFRKDSAKTEMGEEASLLHPSRFKSIQTGCLTPSERSNPSWRVPGIAGRCSIGKSF